ncbi:MAG: FCD domain-containing protein [Gemmatimonadales bacterium]
MVTPITSADVIELFEIVSALEGLAAEQAARLADEPRALLVAMLTDLNTEYGRLASLGDDEDLLYDLDTRFHATYVEAGAGPRILAMHYAVKPQAERYIRFHQTVLREQIETSVVEHSEIVARIEAADAAGSFEAVRTNWQNAAERLSRAISQRGEAPGSRAVPQENRVQSLASRLKLDTFCCRTLLHTKLYDQFMAEEPSPVGRNRAGHQHLKYAAAARRWGARRSGNRGPARCSS